MTPVNLDEPEGPSLFEHSGDGRLVKYIDATKAGDRDAIQRCINDAIASGDTLWIQSLITVNSMVALQLQYVNQSLRIAQREAKGWRNLARGLEAGTQTKGGRNKTLAGNRQLAEAHTAKEVMGHDYFETLWGNEDG